MNHANELDTARAVDLLNRCWMTHDGMWFLHCFREFGIKAANRLNKSAIRSLAPLEITRFRAAQGIEEPIRSLGDLKEFFVFASALVIPEFMGAKFSFPAENRMHWEFEPLQCFAYKGMKRIGALEGYECGVLYRIECWFEALGLKYTVSPRPVQCAMQADGTCFGDFEIILSEVNENERGCRYENIEQT